MLDNIETNSIIGPVGFGVITVVGLYTLPELYIFDTVFYVHLHLLSFEPES
jgi:hypothetical protein